MACVTIAAVGDVIPGFEPPETGFDHVLQPLRSADLRFAQSEFPFSVRGGYQQQAGASFPQRHPRMAAQFKGVPFDVLSIASNHAGDWGPDALEDTVETFRLLGISTVGSGRNIAEARRPAVFERSGLRIAFLGYVSVIPPQYWATQDRGGSAPMRAHTFYEPYEFQPGAPPRVVTVPHAADLEHLVEDVRQAKRNADLVFVSLHWGVHYMWRPCDYQPMVAHAAIDAGATAVIGHHPHQWQAIEAYQDGIIFYSIGNFSTYRAARRGVHSYCQPNLEYTHNEVYSVEPDPGFVFDYKRHCNESAIAFIEVDRLGIARVTCMPTLMNAAGQSVVMRPDQPEFENFLTYLNWTGKFVPGGITGIRAAGDRYQVFSRGDGA